MKVRSFHKVIDGVDKYWFTFFEDIAPNKSRVVAQSAIFDNPDERHRVLQMFSIFEVLYYPEIDIKTEDVKINKK